MNAKSTSDSPRGDALYRTIAKAIYLAAGVYLALWFLDTIITVVLIFLLAMVLVIALNPPVSWLEARRVPRSVGAPLVLTAVTALAVLMVMLAAPEIVRQTTRLSEELPKLADNIVTGADSWLSHYPELQERIRREGVSLQSFLPSVQTALLRVGRYTLSILGTLFFAVILLMTVAYALIDPKPLIKSFLTMMPESLRDPAERALIEGSRGVVGWVWSNVIIGVIEGGALAIFLTFMGVPGALVFGALGFFAELIPRIGPYLVGVPAVLVAYAVSPMTALWTLVFLVALNEVTGSGIAPYIRGRTMKMHPVTLMFWVLALGSAFGFLGAVLATPIAGFMKAFYEEFYVRRQPPLDHEEERAERVLSHEELGEASQGGGTV